MDCVLFKDYDTSYKDEFENNGFTPIFISPLKKAEYLNLDILHELFSNPPPYKIYGLIFTSHRACQAIQELKIDIHKDWFTAVNCYAVGKKTLQASKVIGFKGLTSEEDEGAGTSKGLGSFIIKDLKDKKVNFEDAKFVFLCGLSHMDSLPTILQEAKIPLQIVIVYSVPSVDNIIIPEEIHMKSNLWLIFFSPNGFKLVLKEHKILVEKSLIATIGETTAKSIREEGFVVHAIAKKPTCYDLIEGIRMMGR